jgi:hypothetical protein
VRTPSVREAGRPINLPVTARGIAEEDLGRQQQVGVAAIMFLSPRLRTEIVALIDQLLDSYAGRDIATILNALGYL